MARQATAAEDQELPDDEDTGDAEGEVTETSTGSKEVTMSGVKFTLSSPYAEGHVVNAAEAAVLNQTRAENISNQLRTALKNLKSSEVDPSTEQPWTSEEARLEAMRTLVAKRDAEYAFDVRSPREPRATDPVDKEAKVIARQLLSEALAKAGIKAKDYGKEKTSAKIAEIMANPEVRAAAEANVRARSERAPMSVSV